MARVQDKTIRLVNYTPNEAMPRKLALDKLCQKYCNENKGVRTNIRPGEDDFEVYIKTKPKSEYEQWKRIPMTTIDPENTLPPINSSNRGSAPFHNDNPVSQYNRTNAPANSETVSQSESGGSSSSGKHRLSPQPDTKTKKKKNNDGLTSEDDDDEEENLDVPTTINEAAAIQDNNTLERVQVSQGDKGENCV